MTRLRVAIAAALLLGATLAHAADPPAVRDLRTREIDGVVYFHVRLEPPRDLKPQTLTAGAAWSEGEQRQWASLPRLVPQDGRTQLVYLLPTPPENGRGEFRVLHNGTLDFVGRRVGNEDSARLLLLYSTPEPAEASLTLDFRKAKPADTDLRKAWATGQASFFAVLDGLTTEFGFPGFARTATNRKYGVSVSALQAAPKPEKESDWHRLYRLTTGRAAVAETLQADRLQNGNAEDGKRTVKIADLPGIDLPRYAWEKSEKKPDVEPLAKLVPADNYYFHFDSVVKFLEIADLYDQWIDPTFQIIGDNSWDHRISKRYEQQICLPRDAFLARQLGPLVIRGLALTGSDLYIQDGSDVAVLVHAVDPDAFKKITETYIQNARKRFGKALTEKEISYENVPVETFLTPHREVSLYRATVGDFVIHANSPVGLERILDTRRGKLKSIADSPDFRFMRTVFPRSNRKEDGFAFLPDAYTRRVASPAVVIADRRRREAKTSLQLMTNAALFTAWETGKTAPDRESLLRACGLRPGEVRVPEGKDIRWDAQAQLAVSDAYNTIHFLTPLIEMPVDRVTATEKLAYRKFREEFRQTWQGPVGVIATSFSVTDRETRIETHVTPLGLSGEYARLRRATGDGTTSFSTSDFAGTLLGFLAHLSPAARRDFSSKDSLGDRLVLRLDDGKQLPRLADLRIKLALATGDRTALQTDILREVLQLPLLAGVRVADRKKFDEDLESVGGFIHLFAGPFDMRPVKPAYEGVTIQRVEFSQGSALARFLNGEEVPREKRIAPVFYHAHIDGAWYLGLSEAMLREQIDRGEKKKDGTAVNDALIFVPKAATHARAAIDRTLEWETHTRALQSELPWLVLYRGGLVNDQMGAAERNARALRYLGFIPISLDDTEFSHDGVHAEIVNPRHGSLRKPDLRAGVDPGSPLGKLLAEIQTVQAELRLGEGLRAVLTVERDAQKRKGNGDGKRKSP